MIRVRAKWLKALPSFTSVAHQAERLAAASIAAAIGGYRVRELTR